jgi:peptide/nickel transport system substrate-binding protein
LEPDLTKRQALYRQLTEKVLHDGPYVVLYQPVKQFGRRANVSGFVWNPMAFAEFRNVGK